MQYIMDSLAQNSTILQSHEQLQKRYFTQRPVPLAYIYLLLYLSTTASCPTSSPLNTRAMHGFIGCIFTDWWSRYFANQFNHDQEHTWIKLVIFLRILPDIYLAYTNCYIFASYHTYLDSILYFCIKFPQSAHNQQLQHTNPSTPPSGRHGMYQWNRQAVCMPKQGWLVACLVSTVKKLNPRVPKPLPGTSQPWYGYFPSHP